MQVDVWSDVVCPFCYLGQARLARVARERGVALQWVWHSFELDPDAPAARTGSSSQHLADKYGMALAEAERQQERIATLFEREGLVFNWRTARGGNTRNAHRIIHAAQDKGLGNEAEEAFFRAYFVDGRAVGEPDTVRAVAADIGLSAEEIDTALSSAEINARIEEDIRTARGYNVRGVPFFVFENRVAVSGAQPDDVFAQAMERVAPKLDMVGTEGAVCDDDGCRIPD